MTSKEELLMARVGRFARFLDAQPSRRQAGAALRSLRTGDPELDRALCGLSELVFELTRAKSLLLRGHPQQHLAACAGN
jgi:hypothetical protein